MEQILQKMAEYAQMIRPTQIFPLVTFIAIILFFSYYLKRNEPRRKKHSGKKAPLPETQKAELSDVPESEAEDGTDADTGDAVSEQAFDEDFYLKYVENRYPQEIGEAFAGQSTGEEAESGLPAAPAPEPKRRGLRLPQGIHPMTRKDVGILLIIMAVYTAVAFWGLGSHLAPEKYCHFGTRTDVAEIELDRVTQINWVEYFTGLYTGSYMFSWSEDGHSWQEVAVPQNYDKLLYWMWADFAPTTDEPVSITAKYIRITATDVPLEMGELGLFGEDNLLISKDRMTLNTLAEGLFDEQNTVPSAPSYLNSAYFDEIYHARTALEHIRSIEPYEVSHPPLGKIIIGIGIRVFGMNPFGWRFMGTVFGILMLPFFFVFLKNLFGKTLIASAGTLLFAFDFMHFVQTRIATIDTYGVFFILTAFFFMYRYIALPCDTPFRKTVLPLFLSGLMFGIGCASKWIVIYAGGGLGVIWLLRQIAVGRQFVRSGRRFGGYLFGTVLLSVLFFILMPGVIYVLAYIPYGTARGMSVADGMLWNKEFYKIIWDNQVFMFSYHSKLVAEHPYSSPWFSWLLDIRPILYYLEYDGGKTSAFAAFGNPIVWWGGLMMIGYTAVSFFKTKDTKALFIVIGYLAQILPWVFISRIVFIYHYFPSTLFLVLAIAYAFDRMYEIQRGRYKRAIVCYTAAALFLFVVFYPVLTGIKVPSWYGYNFLQWIPSAWPF